MPFTPIDMETWHRRDCFRHFTTVAKSSYALTVRVDITALRRETIERGLRFYPVFTYVVTRAVNAQEAFRLGYDGEGRLGLHDVIHPDYAVIDEATGDMDSLNTAYTPDFAAFYARMTGDMDAYRQSGTKPTPQDGFFIVSCLPWLDYEAFTVNNEGGGAFLFPMVTWGKFTEKEGQVSLPLSLQIHHAAADGSHCARFYRDVEALCASPSAWLD